MNKRILVLPFLLLLAFPAIAQRTIDRSVINDLRDRSDSFMDLIYEGKYQMAFDIIKQHPLAISVDNLAKLQDTVENQLDNVTDVYGKRLESQFITQQPVSDFLVRYIYVVRYEYYFLWWQLVYYRGNDQWLLSSIAFDDDTQKMLDLLK